jgi:hypothetical protein
MVREFVRTSASSLIVRLRLRILESIVYRETNQIAGISQGPEQQPGQGNCLKGD